MIGESIRITGTVQGVGFRPTVWRLANECGVVGRVWNDSQGVVIQAWGKEEALDGFVSRIAAEQPPLAAIEQIVRTVLDAAAPDDFQIVLSQEGEVRAAVTADAATCPECLQEILDSNNRRYRYAFTNCTNCGPRLSIISAIPYDRAHTSMVTFTMCERCQQEYDDPSDRRFHAQPNACPDCGPRLWLEHSRGQSQTMEQGGFKSAWVHGLTLTPAGKGNSLVEDDGCDSIQTAARLIREGRIIAIKGIGGIHLACDAANESAVADLRKRKQRYHKPFALMASCLDMVVRYAEVNEQEAAMLQHRVAPIVVLPAAGEPLASGIAPGQNSLGFMLPYTPLHHLLMLELDGPIVLTSGNRSEEPQVVDNQEAHKRLDGIADYYLLHDRAILNRLDDSVVRVADDKPRLLRRARGYAPQSILLPNGFADGSNVLAMGGELKNTFCLLEEGRATVSQHMGNLEDAATYRDYQHNLQLYRRLFDFAPQVIAVDRHPDYLSTRLGHSLAVEEGVRLIEVQHHHAHIAACMAEQGLPPDTDKVLGVALDGLGYGADGSIWGGEFLLADYTGFERLAHFRPVPMLGGVQAIREPWRNTLAHLLTCFGWEQVCEEYGGLDIVAHLNGKQIPNLLTMVERGLNSPMASSAGRLFDAVAAALGVCRDAAGYEGQAAMELEALAWGQFKQQVDYGYGTELKDACLDWTSLWRSLLGDLRDKVAPDVIAARFHHGLAAAVAQTAADLCDQHNTQVVVLSGGVFQNRLLLERSSQLLRRQGLMVLSPQALPSNDGGISLGQAIIAMAMEKLP